MDVNQLATQTRDTLTVTRVFGEPFERDGVTIVPVARVQGGAGGGGDEQKGAGGGMGVRMAPAGVFAVSDGKVRWYPAVNATAIVLMGQAVGMVAVLVVGRLLRARRGGRARR